MRYKVWRSNKDKSLHPLCREGSEAFGALQTVVRNLGPWTGSRDGEVDGLRLSYRSILAEQAFLVIYATATGAEVFQRAAWLAKSNPITVLPSVASLPESADELCSVARDLGVSRPDRKGCLRRTGPR